MRRLLKHNQLKPLNVGSAQGSDQLENNTQSHHSQVQLAPLSKDNLQHHNKKVSLNYIFS